MITAGQLVRARRRRPPCCGGRGEAKGARLRAACTVGAPARGPARIVLLLDGPVLADRIRCSDPFGRMSMADFDLFEVTKRSPPSCCRGLSPKPAMDRVNVNGGAIALAAPVAPGLPAHHTERWHELERS